MSEVLTQFRELAIGARFLSRDKKTQLVKVSATQAAIATENTEAPQGSRITLSAFEPVWRIDKECSQESCD